MPEMKFSGGYRLFPRPGLDNLCGSLSRISPQHRFTAKGIKDGGQEARAPLQKIGKILFGN